MYKIENKIVLSSSVVGKSILTNEEIGFGVSIDFTCCSCQRNNKLRIVPYETGFSLIPLYDNGAPKLSKQELLTKGIVTETSNWMSHLGELTINDLPTLYFGTNCKHCQDTYICFFSYGEKQPGLMLLVISGIWGYKPIEL